MQNRNLKIQLQKINDLFNKVEAACGNDIEMRSHWAKYICVRVAGFLENVVAEIYGEFVIGASSAPVASYALKVLAKVQNPRKDKFIEIAGFFKKSWGIELEIFIESDGAGAAINAIMTHRHKIAHGEDSDISIVKIRDYFDEALRVVDFIENQCLNG